MNMQVRPPLMTLARIWSLDTATIFAMATALNIGATYVVRENASSAITVSQLATHGTRVYMGADAVAAAALTALLIVHRSRDGTATALATSLAAVSAAMLWLTMLFYGSGHILPGLMPFAGGDWYVKRLLVFAVPVTGALLSGYGLARGLQRHRGRSSSGSRKA